jgi:hypothetical protein
MSSFSKKASLWWVGLLVFWILVRSLFLSSSGMISEEPEHSFREYLHYLIEGVIVSSFAVITIILVHKLSKKDKVIATRILGMRFIWHKRYLWNWLALSLFWPIARTVINIYHNIPVDFLMNFLKAAIFFGVVVLIACFWEGNPNFFSGSKSKDK